MTRNGHVALAIVALAGVGLLVFGQSIPVYTDFDAARELTGLDACDDDGVVEGWHERIDALRTLRYPFMQSGISLLLACATIWTLFAWFARPDGKRLKTPKSRWGFFAVGFGIIGLSWFSQMHSLSLDLGRNEFPWCADTVANPMVYMTIFYVLLMLACLIVGAALSAKFNQLPVHLFQWRTDQRIKSWLVTVPFALIAAVIGFLGVEGAYYSTFLGTPAAIVALYLAEATRSAILAEPTDLTEADPNANFSQ